MEIINPIIVKYYYKIFNQQITKIINNVYLYIKNYILLYFNLYFLLVGISESLRTQQNNKMKNIKSKNLSKIFIKENDKKQICLNKCIVIQSNQINKRDHHHPLTKQRQNHHY